MWEGKVREGLAARWPFPITYVGRASPMLSSDDDSD